SDFSTREYVDPGFGKAIHWDVPLTAGYSFEVLPHFGKDGPPTFWKPWNYGIRKIIKREQFDCIWIHGYNRFLHWRAIFWAKLHGCRVFIRDEATETSARRSALKKLLKLIFFFGLRFCCDGYLAIGSL